MTTTLNVPNSTQPLNEKGNTSKVWYFFWQGLWKGIPPAVESSVTLTPSPFSFVAPQRGFLIVSGGTVSLIQFSRDGSTNYTTGLTAGCFSLSAGDTLIINYSVAPTVTFVPQ